MSLKLLTAVGAAAGLLGCFYRLTAARGIRPGADRHAQRSAASFHVAGLNKTEAEELLDCLEACGVHGCRAAYKQGEEFAVWRE
jgi:hypothetical protein